MCFHVGLLVLQEKVLVQAAFQAHKGISGGSAMVVAELALLTITVLMVLIYLQLQRLVKVQEVIKDYVVSSKVLLSMMVQPEPTEADLQRWR